MPLVKISSVLCLLWLISPCQSRIYRGSVDGSSSLPLLGYFAYDYTPTNNTIAGTFTLEMDYGHGPTDDANGDLTVYIFFSDRWQQAHTADLTCQQKLAIANTALPVVFTWNHTDPLCPGSHFPCFSVHENIVDTKYPVYWYVALAHQKNCLQSVSIPSYTLEFINYLDGAPTQLSYDEYEVVPSYIITSALWLFGVVIFLCSHYQDSAILTSSVIVKLFLSNMCANVIALLCAVIHWVCYASNGVGVPWLLDSANCFFVLSTVLLWLMMSLLSQGYGISRALMVVSTFDRRANGAILVLLVSAYVSMKVWYYSFSLDDNASTTFYASVPGVAVSILQLINAIWCAVNIKKTYAAEDSNVKRNWYVVCIGVYGLYSISVPVVAVATAFVSIWSQFRLATISILVVNSIVYGATIFLFHPSLARDVFKVQKKIRNLTDDESSGYDKL